MIKQDPEIVRITRKRLAFDYREHFKNNESEKNYQSLIKKLFGVIKISKALNMENVTMDYTVAWNLYLIMDRLRNNNKLEIHVSRNYMETVDRILEKLDNYVFLVKRLENQSVKNKDGREVLVTKYLIEKAAPLQK